MSDERSSSKSFNLVTEPWIPVLYADGRWERVGIRKALTDAGQIRQIAASNPMDRVSLIRFLLAILYWCKGNPPGPEDRTRLVGTGRFPAEWFVKLHQQNARFDLLGSAQRFCQDASARRPRPATDLIQEVPTGNNFWHLRHSTDYRDGLCPACCALGLLRLPLFSVSGLPDLRSGINGTPPIYVVPLGGSLLETLCLNWIESASLGMPAWEAPVPPSPQGEPVPLLTGLTLLSRRVLLDDPAPPKGACVACGDVRPALIRTCKFQSAGSQANEAWNDPHVVYRSATKRSTFRAPDLSAPQKFKMDKPWWKVLAEIASSNRFQPGPAVRTLLIVGFATDQAKNVDVWECVCSVPPGACGDGGSVKVADRLHEWEAASDRIPSRLKTVPNRKHVELHAVMHMVRPNIESCISASAPRILSNSDEAWQQAVALHGEAMSMIAAPLAPGFTTKAIERRRQIANTVPPLTSEHAADTPCGIRAKKGRAR